MLLLITHQEESYVCIHLKGFHYLSLLYFTHLFIIVSSTTNLLVTLDSMITTFVDTAIGCAGGLLGRALVVGLLVTFRRDMAGLLGPLLCAGL
jgi:hypothetical protein